MKKRILKINRPQGTSLFSALALCLLLSLIIQCGLYAEQTSTLTEEVETLSADLADKEQNLTRITKKNADLLAQYIKSSSLEESETETGFAKKGGVYLIDDYRQLWTLRQLIAEGTDIEPGVPAAKASYRLRNDIDFCSYDSPVPVFYLGTEERPFCGSFDGDGHYIRGYFPLMDGASRPEAMFYTDNTAKIENFSVSNQTDNLSLKGISAALSAPWEITELERHLADFPECSVRATVNDWELDIRQTAKELRAHWERMLAQEDPRDCYVSLSFCPQDEAFETPVPGILSHDRNIHGDYLQNLQDAFLTLAGAEYSELIEEALAKEEGYLWFLRLERIGGLTCCTFEIGRPQYFTDTSSGTDSYYLVVEGQWEGKEVKRQCFAIPYTDAEWYSIGSTTLYKIERADLNFDGSEDLLIHEGSSEGSGGFWDNYRALAWDPDSGQFAKFSSFPEQASDLDLNRRRIIFHKSEGWAEEYIDVYEIVDGEYICTKELLAEDMYLNWEHVTRLSYYEMGELIETHFLSDPNERDVLYPDLADYWFRG